MMRKSCAVGMRNAILRNYLKTLFPSRPIDFPHLAKLKISMKTATRSIGYDPLPKTDSLVLQFGALDGKSHDQVKITPVKLISLVSLCVVN